MFVKPNFQQTVTLPQGADISKKVIEIPKELQKYNLYIQTSSTNKLQGLNYFSTDLQIHMFERLGQVKVTDKNNRPVSKSICKSFHLRQFWQLQFFRDGYTDMRGRFDYAQSSATDIDSVQKFAVLIASEDHGAVVKEVGKPSTLGTF